MNLDAIYSTQAKISDLASNQQLESENAKQPRKTNVKLNMTGKLLSPIIKFGIEFPDLTDDNLISEQARYLNNDAEINKQSFALLALGYFMPVSNNLVALDQSSAGYNLSQLLSSQFSNLTAQLIKNVNVGVNIHPATTLTKQETDLLISTQLFNDRLSIDGNFGYGGNTIANYPVGDFNMLYRITKNGNLQLKAFNKTSSNLLSVKGVDYTQGVGLMYRKDFDFWGDIFKKDKADAKPPVNPSPKK